MKNNKKNVGLFVIFSIFVCVCFIARLVQLTVFKTVNHINLTSYSEIANERSSITQARRGTIYDTKNQPIAMDTTSYSLFAILRNEDEKVIVKDYDQTAKVLSQYIGLSHDEILEMLRNPEANQIEFGLAGKNLSTETKEAIEKNQLQGIYFTKNTTRQYINDYFASHLIGYALPLTNDTEEVDILSGYLGVEAAFNNQLSGKSAYQAQWREANNLDYLSGDDVYLTLDSRIQNQLEDLMNIATTIYQPKEMGAYVVNVQTGRLLAASQRPTFNLNTREGIDREWRDYLVEDAFEPGSTVKILSMGIAYDHQLYQPNEKYQSGTVEVFDTKISDHNNVGWGSITFEEGLARSSNTAMVTLAQRLGDTQWVEELAKFGFGKSTNSGLLSEIDGSFEFDNPVSSYMSSFGQAFSATPLQLMQAFTSVANHGKMIKVQFVEGVGTNRSTYKVQELGQPMSKAAADHVLKLMINTVEASYGTAAPYKSDLVQVAAKTGTAQIAADNGSGYLNGTNDYLHSVVAFFPADQPKFMIYLFMKQPAVTNGLLGSQILAKTFHPLLKTVMINQ